MRFIGLATGLLCIAVSQLDWHVYAVWHQFWDAGTLAIGVWSVVRHYLPD